MHKLRRITLERVTESIGKLDTQPTLTTVTGEMIITWSTPRLPVVIDNDITEKRVIVTPDEWLSLKASEAPIEDEWIR